VTVGDWYHTEGRRLLGGKPGPETFLSDRAVLTLTMVQPFVGIRQDCAWIRFLHNTLGPVRSHRG